MSEYDSSLHVPEDVVRAARKVSDWFSERNCRDDWELGDVASRSLLVRKRDELKRLVRMLSKLEDIAPRRYRDRKTGKDVIWRCPDRKVPRLDDVEAEVGRKRKRRM